MKIATATSMIVACFLLCSGCGEHSPQQSTLSNSRDLDIRAGDSRLSPSASGDETQSGVESRTRSDGAVDPERIRALIRDLAQIEKPNLGLSPTMSGSGFAPLPLATEMLNGILMDHRLAGAASFTKLVEIGPVALPYLLESLTDTTPTRLTIEHSGGFGGMWYGQRPAIRWVAGEAEMVRSLVEDNVDDQKIAEIVDAPGEFISMAKTEKLPLFLPQRHDEFNSRNPREKRVIELARQEFGGMKGQERNSEDFETGIQHHTVTVGDACYVIIGQITNRTYLAVQYQPTACVYLNSPTHDARIATDVRAVWNSDDPVATVFDSLLLDFRTDREFDAGVRLAFYFPEKSRPVFLKFLEGIDVSARRLNWMDAEIRAVRAMAASKDESVRDRIVAIMKLTTDPLLFANALHAAAPANADVVFRRAGEILTGLRLNGRDQHDHTYSVLANVCEAFPGKCQPFLSEFAARADDYEAVQLCQALKDTGADVPVGQILAPFLNDDRLVAVWSKKTRLRDFAAECIVQHDETLEFDPKGSEDERNQQIDRIWRHCTGIGVRSHR